MTEAQPRPRLAGYIAPAGTPLSLADLVIGLGSRLRGTSVVDELHAALSKLSGHPHCWTVSSGRAAMTIVLAAMRDLAPDAARDEVIVPAYTCYSVPAAIERAGLKPRFCDIDPATLSFDLDSLRRTDCRRVLALVSANLYGLPNALPEIESFARERGVFMLDDAAQALGARIGTRAVGGFGDAGIYSFDKGKNITTVQGGAIVAREGPLARAIAARCSELRSANPATTLALVLKLCAYAMLLRPIPYSLVRRFPFLGLGQTEYETRYPITTLSTTLSGLATRLQRRLQDLTDVRVRNARGYSEALGSLPSIRLFDQAAAAAAAFARFPLLVETPRERASLLDRLNAAGIGATASYPAALPDVPEVARQISQTGAQFRGARYVAERIITLPTHPYCPHDIGPRVREAIESHLGARSGEST